MDTWANEVEPVLPQLVINEFKFAAPGTEEDIGMLEVLLVDAVLRHNLNTTNKLAEVGPVAFWKDTVKESRGKAEDIYMEFPGFVVCIDFFSDVVWFAIERARNIHASVLDCLSMHGPKVFVMEGRPIP